MKQVQTLPSTVSSAISLSLSPTIFVPTQMYFPASLFLVLVIISLPLLIWNTKIKHLWEIKTPVLSAILCLLGLSVPPPVQWLCWARSQLLNSPDASSKVLLWLTQHCSHCHSIWVQYKCNYFTVSAWNKLWLCASVCISLSKEQGLRCLSSCTEGHSLRYYIIHI